MYMPIYLYRSKWSSLDLSSKIVASWISMLNTYILQDRTNNYVMLFFIYGFKLSVICIKTKIIPNIKFSFNASFS